MLVPAQLANTMTELTIPTAVLALLALLADRVFGEPRRCHPLVGFGRFAHYLEARLNQGIGSLKFWAGALAYTVAVLPPVLMLYGISVVLSEFSPLLEALLSVVILYLAVGWQSMREHVQPILTALEQRDLPGARQALSYIVSRDTAELNDAQVLSASIETTLENSSDALFASLFWFAVAGPCGVLVHRLSNTLDAMWGYRNARFNLFGRVAARCDDVLNFIPAQLTALSFALVSFSASAIRCLVFQGWRWKSINAGAVMASGAAALGITVGGAASYHGQQQQRATLGAGRLPQPGDVRRSVRLVDTVCAVWLLSALVGALL